MVTTWPFGLRTLVTTWTFPFWLVTVWVPPLTKDPPFESSSPNLLSKVVVVPVIGIPATGWIPAPPKPGWPKPAPPKPGCWNPNGAKGKKKREQKVQTFSGTQVYLQIRHLRNLVEESRTQPVGSQIQLVGNLKNKTVSKLKLICSLRL